MSNQHSKGLFTLVTLCIFSDQTIIWFVKTVPFTLGLINVSCIIKSNSHALHFIYHQLISGSKTATAERASTVLLREFRVHHFWWRRLHFELQEAMLNNEFNLWQFVQLLAEERCLSPAAHICGEACCSRYLTPFFFCRFVNCMWLQQSDVFTLTQLCLKGI